MTEATCIVTDCAEPVWIKKRGLCGYHYRRAYRLGEFRRESAPHRVRVDKSGATICTVCGPAVTVVRKGRTVCLEAARSATQRNRHGLSVSRADELLAAADWRCEICEADLRLEVYCFDHDHACCPTSPSCGRCVRGVLCRRCNVGIGMLRDRADLALAAATYLISRKLPKNSLLKTS